LSNVSTVSRIAHARAYGPKYFAFGMFLLRVTSTRGIGSPSVIARYGYDLSSLYTTLNGGLNSWIQVNSRCSASYSLPTTVHSTDAAESTIARVRSCRVCSGAK
jgi:hypothetical protein